MKKNIFVTMFVIFLSLFCLSTNGYAELNNISLNRSDDISIIFESENNIDKIISNINSNKLINWSVKDLNQLLDKVDKVDLSIMERATLKREIIRESGFSNFDFKGTRADVLAFKDLKIEIKEIDKDLILYRRSKSGEPESKYGLGYWWSDKKRNIEETRNELAVLEAWGNPLSTEYIVEIPRGIRVLTGITASQTQFQNGTNVVEEYREGGGVQYWINKVSVSWLK
ncbi:autotransporter [Bacillus thuringiensis]|uniref:autotransporter n=1 Tax=Bacillus thuringiensis TaxID=1428 RepID=UPI000A39D8BA|nr:autotransporter [Bacillus thuringiensis]MEC2709764.1 autotransporter [Bacillus thuringiensis]OUB77197.1 autotransporter [Bacillus thuringiensis serovar dakota]